MPISQNISELQAILLKNRGISDDETSNFLNPSYEEGVHDPFLMKDMDKSVDLILKTIESGEKIGVFSDYDADGVPGAVMMKDFFDKINYKNVFIYIPDRHEEGFGLNIDAVSKFAEEEVKLFISIDCGITDIEEVDHANDLGMKVIITDHHLPGEKLPSAYAILDPKQDGDNYPEKMLCGTGVAYKLIQGILAKNRFGFADGVEKWFLDMVGIATLSDMVPLRGENRLFAKYGLMVLRKSRRPGLKALLKKAGVDQRMLVEDDVGFLIAPRINAASRMGHADDAFNLLIANDEISAQSFSDHIHNLNNERKGIVARMVKEMKAILETRIDREKEKGVIVMGNPSWRPSLLGLAANSLVEEHNMPVFLWGREGGEVIKGSCRSNGIVNVVEVMRAAKQEVFIDFGGHSMSGGFSVTHEKIHLLEDSLASAYKEVVAVSAGEIKKQYSIDTILMLEDVNEKTFKEIDALSPFGEGNPKPVFLFKNVLAKSAEQFGKEKNHLKLVFEKDNGRAIEAISFFADSKSFSRPVESGLRIDLVASIEKSFFRGRADLRLRIVDVI